MLDKARLRGIITPMVTPLLTDETLDVAGTRRLVNRLLEAGVYGLFALGSTYELAFAGRQTEAAALQNRLNRLIDRLDEACSDSPALKWPSVVKEGLAMLGICGTAIARPGISCTDDDCKIIADTLRSVGVL